MKHSFQIAVIGARYTGKTSIIGRYVSGSFSNYTFTSPIPTESKVSIRLPNKQTVELQIWDISGSEDAKMISIPCVQNSNAVIFVSSYDVEDSVSCVKSTWLPVVQESRNNAVMCVINKSDIKNTEKSKLSDEVVQELKEEFGGSFIETSALNGNGIDQLFKSITEKYFQVKTVTKNKTPGNTSETKEEKDKCFIQ
ncbi:GTP-binding protein ryh1 [Histomonas meleagridis]|uniref:GTP-binding protein ryh1 n=1 Tax=Histomonas meleagridis TaxID=135588 RepID=UPI003559EE0C|nr:GTP-binding protein ryh1 [Histomonas meleagridis]KAH0800011.1 GTP-binding protein ryh1 [Histomonas meleagridis]